MRFLLLVALCFASAHALGNVFRTENEAKAILRTKRRSKRAIDAGKYELCREGCAWEEFSEFNWTPDRTLDLWTTVKCDRKSCSTGYYCSYVKGGTIRLTHIDNLAVDCFKVSCGDPGTVSWATKAGYSYKYQDTVTYSCYTGYDVKSGNAARTCGSSKTWSGYQPVCGKINCGYPGSVSWATKTGLSYNYKDQVTYSCNTGYELKSGNLVRTCGLSKTWSGAKPVCGKVSCGNPGSVSGATKTGLYYNYQDRVTYSCNTGYELKSGNSVRTCGSSKTWSGVQPVCGKIGCLDPGVGPGADRSGSTFVFGDVLNYWCKSGWNITSGGVHQITCKPDKSWSGTVLQCNRVSCGNPGSLANGAIDGKDFLFGDTVTFTCVKGYEIKSGSTSRKCRADKTWSDQQPTCGKVTTATPAPAVNPPGGAADIKPAMFTCMLLSTMLALLV